MEFPDVGQRCSVATCQQLDFLPFSCPACGKVFCKDHKERGSHDCHQTAAQQDDEQPLKSKFYECYLQECTVKELVPVQCPECNKNFCMRHRHQQDHCCEKMEDKSEIEISPKAKVESIIGRELKLTTKEPKSRKSSKTAAKVMLMKLKLHAVGDKRIPQDEKEYFNVIFVNLDGNSKQEANPMFFSKQWTVGRMIDYIASSKGISNKNNIAGEKKLQLLNSDDLAIDPSERLEDLICTNVIDLDVRTLKLSYSV